MYIQTETTPNPQSLKFIPGVDVGGSRSVSYTQKEQAITSPLATALFAIDGVEGVYLGSDFITVTKAEGAEWMVLKPGILAAIMDFFISGRPVFKGDEDQKDARPQSDDPIVNEIVELIETRVRPAVAQDGGDIVFDRFEDGIVYLEMRGACAGCPSSTATLKSGIENMLKHYIPEVKEVRPV